MWFVVDYVYSKAKLKEYAIVIIYTIKKKDIKYRLLKKRKFYLHICLFQARSYASCLLNIATVPFICNKHSSNHCFRCMYLKSGESLYSYINSVFERNTSLETMLEINSIVWLQKVVKAKQF